MTETEDEVDGCNEELHQDATSKSSVNTPKTMDSKTFETFKTNIISTSLPNARKNTKQKTTKLKTYEGKKIKIVFNDTSSELHHMTSIKLKKRGESFPVEKIIK